MTELRKYIQDTPLNNTIVQRALGEIDIEVLAFALAGLEAEVQEAFLRNMSRRARALLQDEIDDKVDDSHDRVGEARNLLLQCLETSAGRVTRPLPDAAGQPIPAIRLDSAAEVVATFTALAAYRRRYGVLALERVVEATNHPLVRIGIESLVDGTDPLLVRSLMERYKTRYLRNVETILDMVVDGIESLQSGEHPTLVEGKLRGHILPP